MNDILINNYWLCKWGLKENDMCTFCNEETEEICHLFWECMFTQQLWKNVYRYIIKKNEPDKMAIFLGVDDVKECLIIFVCKKYIYISQLDCTIPTYDEFLRHLNKFKHMEFLVAEKNNKVDIWSEIWRDV